MVSKVQLELRRVSSALEDDHLELRVTDCSSGLRVLTAKMELAQLGELLTGRSAYGNLSNLLTTESLARVGLDRVTEVCYCAKVTRLSNSRKKDQRNLALAEMGEINEHRGEGPPWELWDDGTTSQQPSKAHRFVICRYLKS